MNKTYPNHEPLPEVLWWHTAPVTRSSCQPCPPYCSVLQAPTLCFTLGPEPRPTPPATAISSQHRQHNLMLHTSLRQFPGKSKEHDLLWNWLHCNKPSITSDENSGKEFCIFYWYQMSPIEEYSFTTDLFGTLYLHV